MDHPDTLPANPFARIAYPDEQRQAPQPSERLAHVTTMQMHGPEAHPYRYACSCGDRGIWHVTPERAQAGADRHVKVKEGKA